MWLHSSVGRASNRHRGGHGFESRWSPDFFQASSFQLLKLENSLRWSFFTFIYNRSSNMDYFIYFTSRKKILPWTLDKKIDYKKQVMFLLIRNIHSCYFLQLACKWNMTALWSNGATNLSPPPTLKMTDIKQSQQTTKKSKVCIILPPSPPLPNEKV